MMRKTSPKGFFVLLEWLLSQTGIVTLTSAPPRYKIRTSKRMCYDICFRSIGENGRAQEEASKLDSATKFTKYGQILSY